MHQSSVGHLNFPSAQGINPQESSVTLKDPDVRGGDLCRSTLLDVPEVICPRLSVLYGSLGNVLFG